MERFNHVLDTVARAGALVGVMAVAGFTHAAPVDPDVVTEAIEDAGIGGNIQVTVNDEGVVRLTGLVSESFEGQRAARAAGNVDGVTDVIDLLRTDDD